MQLPGSRTPYKFEALEALPGLSNYFIGVDPRRWRRHIGGSVSDGFIMKVQDGAANPSPGVIALNNAISYPQFSCSETLGSVCLFQVERLDGGAGTVSAVVGTSDGTAIAGLDYDALALTSTFAENKCQADYQVSIRDDAQLDPDETFDVSLSNLTGGATPASSLR
jgi:hypothetical protein